MEVKSVKKSTKHECETTEGTSPHMSGWHQRSLRAISEQLLVIIPQWVSLLSSWLALLSVSWTLDWSVMSRVHEYFTLTWHFNFVPCNRLRHSSQSSKRGTYWSGFVCFFFFSHSWWIVSLQFHQLLFLSWIYVTEDRQGRTRCVRFLICECESDSDRVKRG